MLVMMIAGGLHPPVPQRPAGQPGAQPSAQVPDQYAAIGMEQALPEVPNGERLDLPNLRL